MKKLAIVTTALSVLPAYGWADGGHFPPPHPPPVAVQPFRSPVVVPRFAQPMVPSVPFVPFIQQPVVVPPPVYVVPPAPVYAPPPVAWAPPPIVISPQLPVIQPDEITRKVQWSLNQLMGTNLNIDGIMGPDTASTLISFQMVNGLVPDGIAGTYTLLALDAQLRAANIPLPRY